MDNSIDGWLALDCMAPHWHLAPRDLKRDITYLSMASRTFSDTSFGGFNRKRGLERIFRPPKPRPHKEVSNSAAQEIPILTAIGRTTSLHKIKKEEVESGRSEDKENIPSFNRGNSLDHSFTKMDTSNHKSTKRFIIRKASPARSIKREMTDTQPPTNSAVLVKQNSLKYRNVVDRSRSVTSEAQVIALLKDLPKITSRSWVAFDSGSREALFGYKYGVKREVASLTKLMTVYTACKIIEDSKINPRKFDVTISQYAASMIGTSANLKTGDKLTLYDLFFGSF